jgi:hypothetical protein
VIDAERSVTSEHRTERRVLSGVEDVDVGSRHVEWGQDGVDILECPTRGTMLGWVLRSRPGQLPVNIFGYVDDDVLVERLSELEELRPRNGGGFACEHDGRTEEALSGVRVMVYPRPESTSGTDS